MIIINKKNKTKYGYAILELLFYISLFAILTIVVIDSMITMARSFKETTIQEQLVQSGTIMERMSREIRQAVDINSISGSDLKLDTKDASGNSKTVEFVLSGTDIHFLENNVLTGNLNTPNTAVTAVSFTSIVTNKSTAIKVVLSVRSVNDSLNRSVNFYDTIVLRGSY